MTHDEQLLHKRLRRILSQAEDGNIIFKSYKDLCTKLQIPVKGGDSKKAQLKKLSYFCDIQKSEVGNVYILTEVYLDPDDNILKEKVMIKSIEVILLSEFLKQNEARPSIILDTHALWKLFGFVNYRYGIRREENYFLEETNISKEQLKDFKSRSRKRFDNIIVPALDMLESRALILYNKVKIIITIDGMEYKQRVADEKEVTRILKYERAALKYMKCETIQEVWFRSKEKMYYDYLNEIVQKKEKWFRVANGFNIVVNNRKWLKDGLDSDINVLQNKYKVNQEILNLLRRNAETRYSNYVQELEKEHKLLDGLEMPLDRVKKRLPIYKKRGSVMEDNYLENQEQLMDFFISTAS